MTFYGVIKFYTWVIRCSNDVSGIIWHFFAINNDNYPSNTTTGFGCDVILLQIAEEDDVDVKVAKNSGFEPGAGINRNSMTRFFESDIVEFQ